MFILTVIVFSFVAIVILYSRFMVAVQMKGQRPTTTKRKLKSRPSSTLEFLFKFYFTKTKNNIDGSSGTKDKKHRKFMQETHVKK